MGFELPADPGDPGQPNTRVGRLDESRASLAHRLLRDGVEVLAHGAMTCPHCNLPVSLEQGIPVSSVITCAFCDHAAPARRFLADDVFDTVGNEAQLVARLGPAASGPR